MMHVKFFMISFALFLAGCKGVSGQAIDNGENKAGVTAPLLASDLVYHSDGGDDHYSLEITPALHIFPNIVKSVKSHIIKDWNFSADTSKPNDPNSADTWNWAKVEANKVDGKLLSFRAYDYSFYQTGNGNFQKGNIEAYFYDVQDSKLIKISDVFYDWPAARSLIQKRLCDKVAKRGMCPDVEKLPIYLNSSVAKYDRYIIETDSMIFGYHAAGAINEEFELDEALYKLINPRYRDDFEIYSPCC